ncbi:MAG: hypothetical protein IT333_00580 [Thermomicrobiales bacterium]|nr:hypothetical protein [Thermomicrobiales bacterium]
MIDRHDRDRQLDDLLNALNRGEVLSVPDDNELAGLIETAQQVHDLDEREPDAAYPTQLAAFLERELRTPEGGFAATILPASSKHRFTSTPEMATLTEHPQRRARIPEALLLAAAIVAFAIVGAVLALVLRGDEPDFQVAAPSTMASPTVTTVNDLLPDASGIYRPESFAEAQTLVPFRLVEPGPESGSAGLHLAAIEVQPSIDGDLKSPRIFQAMYVRSDGKGAFGMEQRGGECVLPELDSPQRSSIQIWDVPISKVIGIPQDFYTELSPGEYSPDSVTPVSDEQFPVAIYSWQREGTCVMVGGMLQNGVSATLMEQFITRLLAPQSWVAPTPDVRRIIEVPTFDEARMLASYSLVEPAVSEYGIELDSIEIQTDHQSPDTVTGVVAYYWYDDSMNPLEFHQHPVACGYPDDSTGIEITSQEDLILGSRQVRKTLAVSPDGMPIADFRWESDSICYFVAGAVPDDLALKRMQQVVEAVPVPATSSAPIPTVTPAPDAWPHDDGRAVLDAWPNYGDGSEGVVVRGRGFMPDTSVAITGNALGGETRGPVAEAVVRSDGSFDVELTPEQLAEACADALPGQVCRIVATPGTMTQLTDPKGSDAYTVIVFGEGTPKVVLERMAFPACGVEIALNGAQWDAEAGAAARDCLITAADAGQVAELIYVQQTIEGDLIVSIYRVNDDGTATILADATRDRFGVDGWTMTSCDADVQSDGEPAGPVFAVCGEPVPIE